MKTSSLSLGLSATLFFASPIAYAQTFPLSDNSWSNPEFVERFMGSYGVNSEIFPKVNPDESTILEEIRPLIESDPRAAIRRVESAITADSSAALDFIAGNLYFQEQDYRNAVRNYEAAVKKFPTFLTAYQNLGRAYVFQDRYDEALPFLTKAVELGGGDGSMYGLIGYCYMNDEKFSSALDAYRLAIMLDPGTQDWVKGKLSCLMSMGKYEDAIPLLYELIDEDPGNAEYWKWQANSFISTENEALAAANLEILRSMGRADGSSLTLLGDIYMNQNLPGLALVAYEDAMGTGRLSSDKAFRIADYYLARGDYEEAQAFLTSMKGMSNSMSASEKLEMLNLDAQLALAEDRTDDAAALLLQVIEQDPLNGKAQLTLAEYHQGREEFAKAELYAGNAIKLEDFEHDGLLRMARIKVDQRKFGEAVRFLERAQQLRYLEYVAAYLDQVKTAASRFESS